jgi:uncharacterized protein (DUF58 family)
VTDPSFRRLLGEARAAASVFRLPFRSRVWKGGLGNWAGAGAGSSIDFQDHRPYVPGDDPRHVDWQAYARSGHYVMKLYREEVSPLVDLVLDGSGSMGFDADKKKRSLELFFFAAESAFQSKCSVSSFLVGERGAARLSLPAVMEEKVDLAAMLENRSARADIDFLARVPFRPASLRVLVSDCLLPGAPQEVVLRLVSGRGQGLVLAPACRSESSPNWLGDVDLEDCETGARRLERIDPGRLEEYRRRYRNHFSLWQGSCRRFGVPFARIPAEEDLREVLRSHALPAAAVETVH